MPLLAKETGGDFELPPEGVHNAVCTKIIDLGMQESTYNGTTSLKRKVLIEWELDEVTRKDGEPFLVASRYTLSLGKNAQLRKVLQSWRGKSFTKEELAGFDLEKVLGAPCQLQIVHNEAGNGNTYANVETIMPLGKGAPKPTPSNELLIYSCDNPDGDVLSKLSEKLGDIVTSGQHRLNEDKGTAYSEQKAANANVADDLEDEIPF